jgi:hypothetical protein
MGLRFRVWDLGLGKAYVRIEFKGDGASTTSGGVWAEWMAAVPPPPE